MRIRRKKHLEERLNEIKEFIFFPNEMVKNVNEAIKNKEYIDIKKYFGNNNPINLEIGCGKGQFVVEMAKKYPNENFIAVELLENIIVMAAERVKENNLKNVLLINSGGEYLPKYIKPNSVKNIFLNFSPPYPKDGYESHRLTSDRFIDNFIEYLIEGGEIYQKTDDKNYFEYSFNQFLKFDFITEDISDKLNNGKIFSPMTEYEKKFRDIGKPIYALKAYGK